MIVNNVTQEQLFLVPTEQNNPFDTPVIAYATWAGQLGLDPAANLGGISNADDAAGFLDLGFVYSNSGSTSILGYSTENQFYFYTSEPTTSGRRDFKNGKILSEQTTLNRGYIATSTNPVWTFVPKITSQDSKLLASKWNKTDYAAILHFQFVSLSSNAIFQEVALKITKGALEAVISISGETTCKLQMFYQDSATTSAIAIPGIGNFATTLPASSTTYWASRELNDLTGTVIGSGELPIMATITVYESATGAFVARTTTEVDGTYAVKVPAGVYMVIAQAIGGAEEQNALIQDLITVVDA